MERIKAEFNVLEKISIEREKRNWTEYTLAKNSGISQSTISTWYRKKLQPSIASIEKICKGLDITLAQFFSYDVQSVMLTESQQTILNAWKNLNDEQKKAVITLLTAFDKTNI